MRTDSRNRTRRARPGVNALRRSVPGRGGCPASTGVTRLVVAGTMFSMMTAGCITPPILRVQAERYRIEEPIASGGMGTVFRGEHLHMRKRVAIKILHAEIEGVLELAEQFEREAIAGAHISHPNVATATDFGRLDDGSFFLIQE